jgi:carotenoid cleavage dioxygenase-like enzyme
VVDLADGSVAGRHQAEPFFAFHHVNAYEDGRELVVDLCAYRDAQIVSALYLDALRAGRGIPLARPTRYRLDLRTGRVRPEPLAGESLELPGIAYRRHNGRPYRHAYGVGARGGSGDDFTNQLVKVDVGTGECRVWHEAGCYPGEPVLVPAPAAAAEDDGVVLSVVLDPGARRSYLLVLDARSFTELARAEVPHAIPFGFHGRFTPDRPPAGESP